MPRADAVPVEFWETGNIEEHLELIRRQTHKSVRDPELRRLALKIVNNTPDEHVIDPKTGHRVPIVVAYGQMFRLPLTSACAMKDAHCESQALWDFAVLNVRYVEDPDGFDLFCTAEQTLLAGGGDCDDFVILLGALHKLVGFRGVVARVVSTDAKYWEHVYLLVGFPKHAPAKWVALDPTVKGATPGWQYNRIKTQQDFVL